MHLVMANLGCRNIVSHRHHYQKFRQGVPLGDVQFFCFKVSFHHHGNMAGWVVIGVGVPDATNFTAFSNLPRNANLEMIWHVSPGLFCASVGQFSCTLRELLKRPEFFRHRSAGLFPNCGVVNCNALRCVRDEPEQRLFRAPVTTRDKFERCHRTGHHGQQNGDQQQCRLSSLS